jgi:hypothetical protein
VTRVAALTSQTIVQGEPDSGAVPSAQKALGLLPAVMGAAGFLAVGMGVPAGLRLPAREHRRGGSADQPDDRPGGAGLRGGAVGPEGCAQEDEGQGCALRCPPRAGASWEPWACCLR